ncbi:hypothetical protein JIX56_40025 [Streptomyces sp. CA-210063]|nr:hypothetical protein [Streptomyces sp. CA-210063]UUU35555.1 hypothetical protein JIX56_40025 [Streptomyces sp. CA-210063]
MPSIPWCSRAVRALADGWVAEGLFGGAERDAVVAAAVTANLGH